MCTESAISSSLPIVHPKGLLGPLFAAGAKPNSSAIPLGLTFPDGDGYLVNIGGSPHLLNALAALRQQHLAAVADLLRAIDRGKVDLYLNHQFRCAS